MDGGGSSRALSPHSSSGSRRVPSRRRSHWVRRPSAVVCMFLILHTQCSKNTLRNAFHSLCTEWYAPLGAPIPKTTAPKTISLRRLLVPMDLINRNNLFFQHQPVSWAHTREAHSEFKQLPGRHKWTLHNVLATTTQNHSSSSTYFSNYPGAIVPIYNILL